MHRYRAFKVIIKQCLRERALQQRRSPEYLVEESANFGGDTGACGDSAHTLV